MVRLVILSFIVLCLSCNRANNKSKEVKCDPTKKSLYEPLVLAKPLLVTRFKSLDDFKSKVQVKYFNQPNDPKSKDQLNLRTAKSETLCELKSGLSQNDIMDAKNGSLLDKMKFTIRHPFAIRNRNNLEKIFKLARREKVLFGLRDVAFYDLAMLVSAHISNKEQAFKSTKDSSEKGYINTFNHVTAQAIMTSFFTQELAVFVADVHERKNMPELTTGKFTTEQLFDTINYPEDNYVDIINNAIGQELGLALNEKYKINELKKCTPKLLANYLNDLQSYFSWSMGIGLEPFNSEDEVIVRFAYKLNYLLNNSI